VVPNLETGVKCESEKDFGKLSWVIDGEEYYLDASEWVYPPAWYGGST
jgi:hypothetical protein